MGVPGDSILGARPSTKSGVRIARWLAVAGAGAGWKQAGARAGPRAVCRNYLQWECPGKVVILSRLERLLPLGVDIPALESAVWVLTCGLVEPWLNSVGIIARPEGNCL